MSRPLFLIEIYLVASFLLRVNTARPISAPLTGGPDDNIEFDSTPLVTTYSFSTKISENISTATSTQYAGTLHTTPEISTISSTLSSNTVISARASHVPVKVMGSVRGPQGIFSANPPFWVNPCGYGARSHVSPHYGTTNNEDVSLYAEMLFVSADIALTNANSFRDAYVQQTFGANSFTEFAADWTDVKLNWLPSDDVIPKQLGETLSADYLAQTQFDKIVTSGYTAMQTYSVGLEQLVMDMYNNYGTFTENFADLTLDVKSEVLCTLSSSIDSLRITPRPVDVQRTVMPDNERHLENTSRRDMRDFFIFRDLINALEYYKQVSYYHITTSGKI